MMMRMLAAGGIEPCCDGVRGADEDNPRGYYEHERVKGLADGADWLSEAHGKSLKVVSALLEHLPRNAHRYAVVFMQRAIDEVLASQRAMLIRRGRDPGSAGEDRLAALFERHLERVGALTASRADMRVLAVEHAQTVAEPALVAAQVNVFLGGGLDADAMARAVEPQLHRQRGSD